MVLILDRPKPLTSGKITVRASLKLMLELSQFRLDNADPMLEPDADDAALSASAGNLPGLP